MNRFAFLFLLSFLFFYNSPAQNKYIIFSTQEKYGLKNIDGQILIPANYDSIGWSEGLQLPIGNIIGYYDNKWGLISIKNNIITKPKYYHLYAFHKNLIIASVKGKFSNYIFYGIINSKGKAILPFKYSSIIKKGNHLIIEEKKRGISYFGLINENNKILLDIEYLEIKHFSENYFVFSSPENKKGLINSNGKIIIKPTLDNISQPVNGFSSTFKQGKQGLIDTTGVIFFEPEYKSITFNKEGENKIIFFDKWSIINSANKTKITFNCDSIIYTENECFLVYRNNHLELFNPKLESIFSATNASFISTQGDKIAVSKNNKYGVINISSDIFIPFNNDSIYMSNNYFFLKKKNKWEVWNKYGRKISKFQYNDIKPDFENLIGVKRKNYWRFIDFQGNEIPLQFNKISPFTDQRIAKVSYFNSVGTINQFGKWICEPVYDEIEITTEGFSKGKIKRRIDLVGQTGNVVFQTYNHLKSHGAGFLEYTSEGLVGLISKTGKILLYPKYDFISEVLYGDRIFVKKGNYTGVLSSSGKWIFYLSDRFESFLGLSEQYYAVKIDKKYGFVDSQERLRIANRYDSVSLFHEGRAAIKLRNKWGFIDKSEHIIIQPHYNKVSDFSDGLVIVMENDNFGIIDKTGNQVLSIKYDKITKLKSNDFLIKKNEKFGLLNKQGKLIISTEYDLLQSTYDDNYIVTRRKKYGVLNASGLFKIPLMYDQIIFAGKDMFFCMQIGN